VLTCIDSRIDPLAMLGVKTARPGAIADVRFRFPTL